MIVTLNEVEQWCLRALAGAGAPPGSDEDAAAAAGWLVARGFPALEMLVTALERCSDATAAARIAPRPGQRFDADGRSAIFLSGTLVDSAVAAAASSKATAQFTISGLSDPLFLLPIAERYRQRDWRFALQWDAAGARLDQDGPTLLGDAAALTSGDAVEVFITCGRETPDYSALPVTVSARDLADRYAVTLEQGVQVADETWARLKALGMRALVPASEVSRTRGAGSSASDNE